MKNKVLLAAYNQDVKLLYEYYLCNLKDALMGFVQVVYHDHTNTKTRGMTIRERLSNYGIVIADEACSILKRSRKSYYIPAKTFEYKTFPSPDAGRAKYILAPSAVYTNESAINGAKTKVLSLGYPRLDKLFDKAYLEDCRKKLLELLNTGEKFIVFYCPLQRDTAPPIDSQALKVLDEKLKNLNAVLLLKFNDIPVISGLDNIIDSSAYDTDTVLSAADMLISDYDSIIREFICLRRPIAFYPYDLESFTKAHELLYPIDNKTYYPGPVINNFAEIADYIDAVINGQDEYAFYRERCLRTFMRYLDSRSTVRIWKHVLDEIGFSDEIIETVLEQD